MKKTTKILAVVLTLIMLLSTAPLFASAAGAAKPQAIKECSVFDGDELKIDKTVRMELGETEYFTGMVGEQYSSAAIISDNWWSIEINYDEGEDYSVVESFTAVEYGVTVVTVEAFDADFDKIGEYTWLIVVVDPDGMGEIAYMSADDATFRYKETWDKDYGYTTFVYPNIEAADEDGVYCAVVYVPTDNYYSSPVGTDGTIYTEYVGSSYCNVYAIDAAGHIFQDTCTITVKYTFWQWLIRIFLLGFLWY